MDSCAAGSAPPLAPPFAANPSPIPQPKHVGEESIMEPSNPAVNAAGHDSTHQPSFWHRPGFLYFTMFTWISITGGRFLAEFLEQEASLSVMTIGGLLALQKTVGVLTSSVAGQLADSTEVRFPRRGRVLVVGAGVVMGTFAFCLHGCKHLFGSSSSSSWFDSLPWYIFLRIVYAIAGSFVNPVMDAICIDFLKRDGRQGDYGKERLFGAISWATTSLVIGPCLDYTHGFVVLYPMSIVAMVSMSVSLYIYAGGSAPNSSFPTIKRRTSDVFPMNEEMESMQSTNIKEGNVKGRQPSSQPQQRDTEFLSSFALFGKTIYSLSFLVALVTLASGQAVVNDLVFLLFEFLGSTYSLMSLTVILTVAFEIPLFQLAPALLDRLGSSGLMLVAGLCYIFRVIGYTLVPTGKTAWVLLLEPLHGVTYAASQTASVDFAANLISEPGKEALGQGVLQFFIGGGSVIGLGVGGWLQEQYGPRVMYRVSALVVLLGAIVLGVTVLGKKGGSVFEARHHTLPQEEDVVSDMENSNVEMVGREKDSGNYGKE